jgi:hypothetical protein
MILPHWSLPDPVEERKVTYCIFFIFEHKGSEKTRVCVKRNMASDVQER